MFIISTECLSGKIYSWFSMFLYKKTCF